MSAKLLRHSTYNRKPWNNGGGTTQDVWLRPGTASQGGFDIRLSLASIDTDGPFSSFPGIDRTITQVAGAPFVLDFGDTVEQAVNRAGLKMGNAGRSAMMAGIEMADLMKKL